MIRRLFFLFLVLLLLASLMIPALAAHPADRPKNPETQNDAHFTTACSGCAWINA